MVCCFVQSRVQSLAMLVLVHPIHQTTLLAVVSLLPLLLSLHSQATEQVCTYFILRPTRSHLVNVCGFHLPLNAVKERYLVILLEGCVKGRGEVLHMVAHSARVSGVLATTLHTCRCQRKQSKVTTVISLPTPLPPSLPTHTHMHTRTCMLSWWY